MNEEYKVVRAEPLTAFCQRVFESLGVPSQDAHTAAEVLVLGDLRGVESHGVARLQRYSKGLKDGVMVPRPVMRVVTETPCTAVLDGGAALGQVAGKRGMEMAIAKALQYGTGFVAVRNSNHYGIAGYYSQMALKHDLIGISLTNSTPDVVPTFGRTVMIGTNPISVTVPTGQEKPFFLDMATAVVPSGKLETYTRKGQKIPLGWAVDERGRLCDDPGRVWNNMRGGIGGGLLPLGGEGEAVQRAQGLWPRPCGGYFERGPFRIGEYHFSLSQDPRGQTPSLPREPLLWLPAGRFLPPPGGVQTRYGRHDPSPKRRTQS